MATGTSKSGILGVVISDSGSRDIKAYLSWDSTNKAFYLREERDSGFNPAGSYIELTITKIEIYC